MAADGRRRSRHDFAREDCVFGQRALHGISKLLISMIIHILLFMFIKQSVG